MKTLKWRGALVALAITSLAIAGCQDTGAESVESLPSVGTESLDTGSQMESMDMGSAGASGEASSEASPSDGP